MGHARAYPSGRRVSDPLTTPAPHAAEHAWDRRAGAPYPQTLRVPPRRSGQGSCITPGMSAIPRLDEATILRGAVACAIQAPSSHNTQPWRFRRRGAALEVMVDDTRHLEVIDPIRRQMVMSCGCALYNARVAVRVNGFRDAVELFPDPLRPELLAVLRLGLPRTATEEDHTLLTAIERRRTNRRPFFDRPVALDVSDALAHAARTERTQLIRLAPDGKRLIAGLVAEADRRQFDSADFRAELGRWLVPTGSRRKDGIRFVEKEYGSALPFSVTRRLRTLDLGESFGELERELVRGSPLVAVLATEADDPIDWLDCGQAMQAVLLRATALGLSAAFLNQVLEIDELREEVAVLCELDLEPQMILRLGYADPVDHPAPRRALEDVLIEED